MDRNIEIGAGHAVKFFGRMLGFHFETGDARGEKKRADQDKTHP